MAAYWRVGASQPSRPTGTNFRDIVFPDFTKSLQFTYTVSRACASIYRLRVICTIACCWWYIGLRFAGSTAVLCTTAGSFACCYFLPQPFVNSSIICSQLCMLLACIYIHKQPVLQSSSSCSTPPSFLPYISWIAPARQQCSTFC